MSQQTTAVTAACCAAALAAGAGALAALSICEARVWRAQLLAASAAAAASAASSALDELRTADAERQAAQEALTAELAAERGRARPLDGALQRRGGVRGARGRARGGGGGGAPAARGAGADARGGAQAARGEFPPRRSSCGCGRHRRRRRATPPPTPPGQYDTAPESPSPATGSSPEAVRAARQADAAQRAASARGCARGEVLREERAEREAKLEQLGLLPGDSLSMRADDAEYAHLGRG